eukprot:8039694-Alexandrium_andersonii.AAC.1
MPAEAALSLTDLEYRTMARARLATPVITSGHTRQAPCGVGSPGPSFSHLPGADQTPARRGR